jgi:hypothetical protein
MKDLKTKLWKIGDHYIDCGHIPRVVTGISYELSFVTEKKVTPDNYRQKRRSLKQEALTGRSLIDGSLGDCSIRYCAPQRIHKGVAERWAKLGPLSKSLKEHLKQFYAGDWGNSRKIWWKEQSNGKGIEHA